MTIEVNKELISTSSKKLKDLIEEMRFSTKGIAIAVNNEVIPRLDWEETILKEHDKITIIKATQGG